MSAFRHMTAGRPEQARACGSAERTLASRRKPNSDRDGGRRRFALVRPQRFGAISGGDLASYARFLADEGEARVGAACPGSTYDRLAVVKADYHPDNLSR